MFIGVQNWWTEGNFNRCRKLNTPILYSDEHGKRLSVVQDNAPGQMSPDCMLTLSTRVFLFCDTLGQAGFAFKGLSRRSMAFRRQMIVVIRCRGWNSFLVLSLIIFMRATRWNLQVAYRPHRGTSFSESIWGVVHSVDRSDFWTWRSGEIGCLMNAPHLKDFKDKCGIRKLVEMHIVG